MNCADANWLTATYLAPGDTRSRARHAIVERLARRQPRPVLISRVAFAEARNVFSRITLLDHPPEWRALLDDVGTKLLLPVLPEEKLEAQSFALFARYSRKLTLGTSDVFIIAAGQLAGATGFLSFDGVARALASAEGLDVFPELNELEKSIRARLKRA